MRRLIVLALAVLTFAACTPDPPPLAPSDWIDADRLANWPLRRDP
jgi:hypothetical protein